MSDAKVYATGLYGKKVETKFGEITKLSIKAEEFAEFLNNNANDEGWVTVDLLTSKDSNKLYGVLNTYVSQKSNSEKGDGLPF